MQLGGVKVETGEYKGNGLSGSKTNANSLTFSFVPKMVYIIKKGSVDRIAQFYCFTIPVSTTSTVWVSYGYLNIFGSRTAPNYNPNNCWVQLSDKTLRWYNELGANEQLNENGVIYNYMAIG